MLRSAEYIVILFIQLGVDIRGVNKPNLILSSPNCLVAAVFLGKATQDDSIICLQFKSFVLEKM